MVMLLVDVCASKVKLCIGSVSYADLSRCTGCIGQPLEQLSAAAADSHTESGREPEWCYQSVRCFGLTTKLHIRTARGLRWFEIVACVLELRSVASEVEPVHTLQWVRLHRWHAIFTSDSTVDRCARSRLLIASPLSQTDI